MKKPFLFYTDTLRTGLGAVLSQQNRKEEYVVIYANRTLSLAEKNYGITEKKYLAIIWAVKYF